MLTHTHTHTFKCSIPRACHACSLSNVPPGRARRKATGGTNATTATTTVWPCGYCDIITRVRKRVYPLYLFHRSCSFTTHKHTMDICAGTYVCESCDESYATQKCRGIRDECHVLVSITSHWRAIWGWVRFRIFAALNANAVKCICCADLITLNTPHNPPPKSRTKHSYVRR